jgi:hypothetical protein
MTTGNGLRMKVELTRLAARHGVSLDRDATLPLYPAADRDVVVEGRASDTTIDLRRCRFAPVAFGYPLPKAMPPLMYRHTRPAGEVTALAYDSSGALLVSAVVRDAGARMCPAFSVAATVNDYEIVDPDDPARGWMGLRRGRRHRDLEVAPEV